MDRKVWIIVVIVAGAIAATYGIYWWGCGHDPSTFFGAVFAAWIGGLALFVITGIVVVIISLAKPEQESFDARARILFRKQTGKHIDYIVSKIREVLEHYAESTSIRVTLKQFHAGERKYLLGIQDTVVLKSYLDDIETTWDSKVEYWEITPPPPQCQSNRLVYVRIDNVVTGISEDFADKLTRPISTRIERDASCKVEYLVEYWGKANEEPHSLSPKRYNQLITLEFENLTGIAVTIQVSEDGKKPTDLVLAPGELRRALTLRDVFPNKEAYEFRVMAP